MPLLDSPVDGSDRPASGPAHRRPVPAARRRKRLVWIGVLVAAVLVLGFLVLPDLLGGSSESDPPAASAQPTGSAAPEESAAEGLPPLPDSARLPGEQLRATIVGLEGLVQSDPDAAGSGADELLDRLRQVEVLGGPEQRSAAMVAHGDVGAAVADGGLAPAVGQQVQDVLLGVGRPERLIDLVQALGVDPAAVGPAGPDLYGPLITLDHDVPADQVAGRAAEVLQDVRAAGERGELSAAFLAEAVPVLEELADPATDRALRDLLAEAERDPAAIGPAGAQVLTSLRAIAELGVWDQGNEAGSLLELVRQDGRVTPEFRAAAVPVLVPLVR